MNRTIKVVLFITSIIVSSVFCSPPEGGEIEGSGTLITMEKPISGFTKIDAGFGIKQLTIKQGEEYQVTLHIDQSFIPYLHVSKTDKTLNIYLEENRMAYYAGEFKVEIITPVLDEIMLLSVIDTKITGFEDLQGLKASLYSSSKLEGNLEVNKLDLQVFLNSEIILTGSADQVNIRAADTGLVDLTEFPARTASVDAKSGSIVKLNVQEQLSVDATGNSKVLYFGSPTISTIVDESSQVEPMD
jgi:hypothetical protein